MLLRNYAKPFCIAGFVLAEIYMLFVVLAPPGHEPGRPLPMPPMTETVLLPGAPVPLGHMISRVLVSAIFFGPFGALVGLGIGLVFSALVQWFRGRKPRGES